MTAYYNEIDTYAAAWLRNLIAAGHIAPGVVDTRSIEDVHPSDLREFTQCHFFAGIGGWSVALRAAGWPDDRPVWTGSCPCQPFSAAGEGAGFADERHLWPAYHHLIRFGRPATVVGEQVASGDADPWLDLVQDDLEGLGYAFGTLTVPSASVGAPHIRDRIYWVGHADHARLEGHARNGRPARRKGPGRPAAAASLPLRLAESHTAGSGIIGLANSNIEIQGGRGIQGPGEGAGAGAGAACERSAGLREAGGKQPGPTNGLWADADWLFCRDGKWRPVEAGTFPLVDGLPRSVGSGGAGLERLAELAGLDNASLARAKGYRVGALRGYGNAINTESGRAFMAVLMECMP